MDIAPKEKIISSTNKFLDLDLYKVKVEDLNFAHNYELQITKADAVHGLVCWFDAHFTKLKNPITLSTSPYSKSTHWRQTIFYVSEPIKVQAGKVLSGSIAVRKSAVNPRDLDIKISFHYNDEATKASYKQMYKLR